MLHLKEQRFASQVGLSESTAYIDSGSGFRKPNGFASDLWPQNSTHLENLETKCIAFMAGGIAMPGQGSRQAGRTAQHPNPVAERLRQMWLTRKPDLQQNGRTTEFRASTQAENYCWEWEGQQLTASAPMSFSEHPSNMPSHACGPAFSCPLSVQSGRAQIRRARWRALCLRLPSDLLLRLPLKGNCTT